jgi:hypothetical protein
MERIDALKQALQALRDTDTQDLSGLTFGDTVLLGLLLWQLSNQARALLKPIKTLMQQSAVKIRRKPGPVCLKGTDGARCNVQIPGPLQGGAPRVSFDSTTPLITKD